MQTENTLSSNIRQFIDDIKSFKESFDPVTLYVDHPQGEGKQFFYRVIQERLSAKNGSLYVSTSGVQKFAISFEDLANKLTNQLLESDLPIPINFEYFDSSYNGIPCRVYMKSSRMMRPDNTIMMRLDNTMPFGTYLSLSYVVFNIKDDPVSIGDGQMLVSEVDSTFWVCNKETFLQGHDLLPVNYR